MARYGVSDLSILIIRIGGRFNLPGSLLTMDTRNSGAPKILCVESDSAVLETRCAVLNASGYDAASASPRVAAVVLSSQKFDLIVISRVSDSDLQRIINLADGADVLVLEELTMPSELLNLVAQRLNRHQRRA
jgi:hypothetical protein